MDESGSIDDDEWDDIVNFVLLISSVHNLFNMGRSRYSAVAFENMPASTVIVGLTPAYAAFSTIISSYSRNDGGTDIQAGIEECQMTFQNKRCGGQSIVVLSDGNPTVGIDNAVLSAIKKSGTRIISVGIGNSINSAVLNSIATSPSCAFRTSFNALKLFARAPAGSAPSFVSTCTQTLINAVASKLCLEP